MSFIRLKRLKEDDPAEALVLSYKRRKLDTDGPSEGDEACKLKEQVFKFVGTVQQKDNENLHTIVKTISEPRKDPKTPVFKNVGNVKSQVTSSRSVNRYKLVNTIRGITSDSCKEDTDESEKENLETSLNKFNVYDAENDCEHSEVEAKPEDAKLSTITCNGSPLSSLQSSEYVYDLYYLDGVTTSEDEWGHVVNIQSIALEETVYTDGYESAEEKYYDEDDSNSESNWRNDYPDESESGDDNESDEKEDEEDEDVDMCIRNMAKCMIDYDLNEEDDDYDFKEEDDDDETFGNAIFKAKVTGEDSD